MSEDLINRLAGLTADHPLARARLQRPQALASAQASYEALFSPVSEEALPLTTRKLIAAYVAALTNEPASLAHYTSLAEGVSGLAEVLNLARTAGQTGPKGRFPDGPLSIENTTAPAFPQSDVFDAKTLAALRHAHFLTLHPRDAAPDHLQALLDAGWDEDAIVTLSQLVAFLSFQIRIVHGLKTAAKV